MDVTNEISVAELTGYLSTWSAYNLYRAKNPDLEDPLLAFKRDLMQSLGVLDESRIISVTTPFCLLLARNPVKPDQGVH